MQTSYKNKILTIPNVLTLVRLILIPVIAWLYCVKDNYVWTAIVIILSGVTDIVDGLIARKFNMISDFGKAFDPIADKLTQFVILICLVTRFSAMIVPCVLLLGKEVISGIVALLAIRKTGDVVGADWHGKVTTCMLYTMMTLHVIWVNIPVTVSNIAILLCTVMMIVSFILYNIRNLKVYVKSLHKG